MVISFKEKPKIVIIEKVFYSICYELVMKANFKIKKDPDSKKSIDKEHAELTEEEFEEFVSKAGAAGTFMVFRSNTKKEDEMGVDELQWKEIINEYLKNNYG